jgi:hypothetical protein
MVQVKATTRPNFLLPVFTEPCEVPTLFATLKRCALHGPRRGGWPQRAGDVMMTVRNASF